MTSSKPLSGYAVDVKEVKIPTRKEVALEKPLRYTLETHPQKQFDAEKSFCLELGTFFIKAGCASTKYIEMFNKYGTPKSPGAVGALTAPSQIMKKFGFGFIEENMAQRMWYHAPLEFGVDGLPCDWNQIDALVSCLAEKQLSLDAVPESILLLESCLSSEKDRTQFPISHVMMIPREVAVLNQLGATTGLVVHYGSYSTRVVPVFNSTIELNEIQVMQIGSSHVTELLYQMFIEDGLGRPSSSLRSIVRIIGQLNCFVAPSAEEALSTGPKDVTIMLPWEEEMPVTPFKLTAPPELYFNPSLGKGETRSLPEAVLLAVSKFTPQQQAVLLSNIVLTGGSAHFKGMAERLKSELLKKSSLNISISTEPKQLHSNLFQFTQHQDMSEEKKWISREEYEALGNKILQTKCKFFSYSTAGIKRAPAFSDTLFVLQ